MPQGMEIYNSAGQLSVSITDRVSRIVNTVSTGRVDGNYTVPLAANSGSIIFFCRKNEANLEMPTVYLSGTTIYWTFNAAAADQYRCSVTIFIGVV